MSVRRIAMWSGPRNLSTALMRSFASRGDCSVVDEPFYAAYLDATGIDHPMKNLILKYYNSDPNVISNDCADGKFNTKIQYQKHMTHHMLDTFDHSFVFSVSNAFLIRSPEKVIRSFGKKILDFNLFDLGYVQQSYLFDMICDKTGSPPPVIDADDLCTNPENILKNLCIQLDITYTEKMLSWTHGPHSYDGVWGRHWYRAVNESTGFIPFQQNCEPMSKFHNKLVEKALPHFERINQHKLSY